MSFTGVLTYLISSYRKQSDNNIMVTLTICYIADGEQTAMATNVGISTQYEIHIEQLFSMRQPT